MRFITKTVYRAFPELDEYSDEQCRRFVSAAKRGVFRRGGRLIIVLLAAGLAIFVAMFVCAYSFSVLERKAWALRDYPLWSVITFGLYSAVVFAVCLYPVIRLREWLLLRRIRYILRARGVCPNCHYSLIGLTVSAACKVVCPECGTEGDVDPALGELVTDADGRARYKPSPDAIRASKPWIPTWFWKKLWWWTWRSVVTVIALAVVALGYNEYRCRADAATAKAEMPTIADLNAYTITQLKVKSFKPEDNAFEYLPDLAVATYETMSKAFPNGPPIYPDSSKGVSIVDGSSMNIEDDPDYVENRAQNQIDIENVLRFLDAAKETRYFERMRLMVDKPEAYNTYTQPSGDSRLTNIRLTSLSQQRRAARWCSARMLLAAREGDIETYADSINLMLGLARMCDNEPMAISQFVADSIYTTMHSTMGAALYLRPDVEWYTRSAAILDSAPKRNPYAFHIGSERLAGLSWYADIFSDPKATRWGKYSLPDRQDVFGRTATPYSELPGRLGSWSEIRLKYDEVFQQLEHLLSGPPGTIPGSAFAVHDESLVLSSEFVGGASFCRRWIDLALTHRLRCLDFRTRLAIDKYSHVRGSVPATLQELVPDYLPAIPIDPCTGKPLIYKRVPKTRDDYSGYILYSTGTDQVDNNGNTNFAMVDGRVSLNPVAAGTDSVVDSLKPKHPLLFVKMPRPASNSTPQP